MKKHYIYILLLIPCLALQAQVGINTTSPEGVLDISGSNIGLIYPVVSLTDVNVETISNPNGASLVAGTTVFNTNTSTAGSSSVYPGIYIWTGTKWIPQFNKNDSMLASQTNPVLRTDGNAGVQTISLDNTSFTPNFSGDYRIAITVHFGGGRLNTVSNPQYANFGAQKGEFNFIFNSVPHKFDVRSYSGVNNDDYSDGGTDRIYDNQFHQVTYVVNKTLTRGTTYNFSLSFDMDSNTIFQNSGNSGNGRGYINTNDDIECTIEFNYMGE
ncbi:hypothetical protein POV27_04390 [Aureisphaera galaxeae]|uniref:hypothetical protein n=1 Tax=Aureisphaera galaxeae TaxID=1538023 RepID=UPI002350BE2F|nr:hypothetical protein [Aureisphaera galaxeae]MDC8003275.1 hypothetical protein [Aureisphaera galaxeae]